MAHDIGFSAVTADHVRGKRPQLRWRRRRGGYGALAVVAVSLLALGCSPAPPAHSVDQSNLGALHNYLSVVWAAECSTGTLDAEIAQTFTAGRNGVMDQVSLAAMPLVPGSQAPFTVTIRTVRPDGAPSATVLGSGTYSGAGAPNPSTLVDVRLSSPVLVLSGHRYAIVASSAPAVECTDDQGWSFFGATDSYGAGRGWWRGTGYNTPEWADPDADYFFRTWVLP